MTKTKRAVKQANKQADKAIRKAKKEEFRAELENWFDKEVKGIKNWHICAAIVVTSIIVNSIF